MAEKFRFSDSAAFGKAWSERSIELLGGVEKVLEILGADERDQEARWNRDIEMIGRILRSHLFVEHYLTEYIKLRNPDLGDLDNARLSFAQKLALLRSSDAFDADFATGIRHLNRIRNRLAHDLSAALTEEDTKVFMSVRPFAIIRAGVFKLALELNREPPASAPIDVLEHFSKMVSSMLQNRVSENSRKMREAIQQAMEDVRLPD